MSTRRDVASVAGVSVRTVSNVVSGMAQVSGPTRRRVLDAIEELGYRPSELARSLKIGRSGLIGLMLPDLDTPYFAEITRDFVRQGTAHRVTVVIDQTDGDRDRELAFLQRAARGSLFDAVVLSPLALTPSDLEGLPSAGPLVFLGEESFPGFDKVMVDNPLASHQAVTHLIDTGRRRIAAIGTEARPRAVSTQRLAGYRSALAAAGLAERPEWLGQVSSFTRQEGYDAMSSLLALAEPPDAVFCFTDPLALGALRALHDHQVAVPGEVAVVGFDDIEDGRFSVPRLSSVRPDKDWLARTTFQRLLARLGGEEREPATLIVPHRLEVRDSSRNRP